MNQPARLYLASTSPRRHDLLAAIGMPFERLAIDVDESTRPHEEPADYVRRLALAKARAGWLCLNGKPPLPVLGADTSVIIDGRILGKPRDKRDGLTMLATLSAREHTVLSAVSLVLDQREEVRLSASQVQFRALDEAEREAYWATGEPADKAGSYGVQGLGATLVQSLRGSHSGVMGLPLYETAELLRAFGIDIWQVAAESQA